MSHVDALFCFPLWLRLTHSINLLFLTLLIRSGIQILSDHPKLYWNKHCTPGSEWIKFTKNVIPNDKLWTSMDEAVNVSPWISFPGGRHNLVSVATGICWQWRFGCYRRAGEALPLVRPPNGDIRALQRFEKQIGQLVLLALRDAGPDRS